MRRSLILRREALTALTTDELVSVAAGQMAITREGLTCPIGRCATVPQSEDLYRTCTCGPEAVGR
ncbi:MAG TPA: hypothetical protein VFQ85_14850 [Mycobacteriales bacterium]|jgi:hypothetical protein|nr:hypothetical protein [Mycobacteriales bacterium]